MARRGHLHYLDGMRGVAALWVALYHTWTGGHIDHLYDALPRFVSASVFERGWLGVPVFFMLSGFVIPFSQARRADAEFAPAHFMHRRWRRLSPPYYAAIALTIAVGLAEERIRDVAFDMPSLADIAAHLAYLQDLTDQPRIGVFFWTLAIEMQFYVVFALMKWLAGRSRWAHAGDAVLAVAMVVALAWPFGVTAIGDGRGVFVAHWFLFLTGQAVFESTRKPQWRLPTAAYVGMLALAAFTSSPDERVAAGTVTGLMLLAFVTIDRSPLERVFSSKPSLFLGRVSYSLYLIHPAVAGGSFWLTFKVLDPSTAGELVALVLVTTAQIVVALVWFKLFEKPSIEWSRALGSEPAEAAGRRESESAS